MITITKKKKNKHNFFYFRDVYVQHTGPRRCRRRDHMLSVVRHQHRGRRTTLRMGTFPRPPVAFAFNAPVGLQSFFSHVNTSFANYQQSGKTHTKKKINLKDENNLIKMYFLFQSSLVVWDVRTGQPIREVRLGHKDSCVFVKQMIPLRDNIVCDFGRQLRIVRFPVVSDKMD